MAAQRSPKHSKPPGHRSAGGSEAGDPLTVMLGGRIRALRSRAGMTMEEFAARAGLRIETVGRVERGEQSPTVRMLSRFAQGLGCDPISFFGDGRDPPTVAVLDTDIQEIVTFLIGRGPGAARRARLAVLAAVGDAADLPKVELP